MSDAIIRQALDSHLNDNAGIDVAWHNVKFTPNTGTPYIRPDLLPAQTVQADLGTSGRNRHRGIYQLTLVYPAGEGRGDVETKATALMTAFKRGTRLVRSGVTVTLEPPYQGPPFQEAGWYRVPINIPYFAYIDPA